MCDAQAHGVLSLSGQAIELSDTQRPQTEMKTDRFPPRRESFFIKFRRTAFPDIIESECNL